MPSTLPTNPVRWRQVETLLDELLELPPMERAARLTKIEAEDAALATEVSGLLAADAAAEGGFLRVSAAQGAVELLAEDELIPAVGRVIGPYRLERLVGEGGMGRVYEARDLRLGRTVALKLLPPGQAGSSVAKERFLREARAASALDHPHLVTVHDLGETAEGELYLVTAFYEGETLNDRLRRGPLGFDEARAITLAVAQALSVAHGAGILHRDIKPANILLGSGGETKVLDFGIARFQGESGPTRTGFTPGTPAYMAPEQAMGEPLDERVDLWGLGATLYEMLTGRRAFPGDDAQAVIHGVLTREPEPIANLRPETPPELTGLVARLLAKRPADRPVSAATVVFELAGDESPRTGAEGGTRAELPAALSTGIAARPTTLLRVLVATDLVGGENPSSTLSEERAFTFSSRHDRALRDLVSRFGGLEVEKSAGFLLLFERAADAVGFALAYQQAVIRLGTPEGLELSARVGLHLGDVLLRKNPEADITRGAKPIEVEGLAKTVAAKVLALASPRQVLLSRAAFDLARRAALADAAGENQLSWLAHGTYALPGLEEGVEICEVGLRGFAPLTEPIDSAAGRRVVAPGEELALGWRPAAGAPIPRRPNWLLTTRLGEGGFGEVWLATHRSGERRVFKFCFEAPRLRALKREVTLFRLLRDALGHRYDIARILDWSFEQPPYFLEAEHSEGGNLEEWAEAQGGLASLPLALRLRLGAEVADALGAAHSVGILHKDVKPENVLVAFDHDRLPHARLTDFGIGRLDPGATAVLPNAAALGFTAVGLGATASVTHSETGGSLRYLAPELLEGKPATIQADLYSLGVMLYQLVAGDFSRALAPGWQRDVEDELLAEDLAQIVDGLPERRPASANEVAERLRTLEARRAEREAARRAAAEATRQRIALERQARQRKLALGLAAAALLVLVVVGFLAVRERRARETAALRQQQAEGLIGYMLGDLRDKLEPVGRLEILDGVGAKALEYFAAVPSAELSDDELARRSQALYQLGDVRIRQGKLAQAVAPLEESLALAKELAGRSPGDPKRLFDLAQSHFWLGSAYLEAGQLEQARGEFLSYFEIASRSLEQDPNNRTWQMELAYAQTNLAAVAEAAGDLAEAASRAGASLALKEKLAAARPEDLALQTSLASGHSWLGSILEARGEAQGSLAAYERELELRRALAHREPGNAHARALLAGALSHAADQRRVLGRLDEAATALDEMRRLLLELTTLDPANSGWQRDLAVSLRQLGELALERGQLDDARRDLTDAQRLLVGLGAAKSPSLDWRRDGARVELALAKLALASGDPAAARRRAKSSLQALDSLLAASPEDIGARGLKAEAEALITRLDPAGAPDPLSNNPSIP